MNKMKGFIWISWGGGIWCLRVVRFFVCIGDWGMILFDGGILISLYNNVWI